MDVAILHKGRFVSLPDARARHDGANAFTVTIPRSREAERAVRRWAVESFDGATMLIGDRESEQVLGTAERGDAIVVTVLL